MKLSSILVLFLIICGLSTAQAQTLNKVYPQQFTGYALSNPMKGFRPDPDRVGNRDYPTTIVRDYIAWNAIETDSTSGVQDIIDFCNIRWKDYEKKNVKVIPRVIILWDGEASSLPGYWPSDLTSGDWTSQKFKDRVVKLIYKLGQAWDNDPRVAWVQTGLMGWWGEQESPVGINQEYASLFGDAFSRAFKNKKFLVRNQGAWESAGYELGTYWDSYAHPGQSGVRNDIIVRNNQGRYLNNMIEGETAYNWGQEVWIPKFDSIPTATLNNDQYTNNMIDAIRELHCTGLGWLASYTLDGIYGSNIATVKANAARVQNAFGYHFVIPEFTCSGRVNQGSNLTLNFKVKNTGSAPFYGNWPVAFTLINETTHAIVWKQILTGVDVNTWLPGDNYNLTTRTYSTPAAEYTINASIQVPAGIPTGQYMAGISILEPNSQSPGVFFAVTNFLTASQTQPLCRVGIGQDLVGGYTINPTIYGSPVTNDARYYSLTPSGTMYKLTTNSSIGGTVSSQGGDYLANTTITLTAKPNLGYQFTGWSGDVTETTTSISVNMTSNKNITANFAVKALPFLAFATNFGGNAYTASDGTAYTNDQILSGGNAASTTNAISGTTDGVLYQTSKWGNSMDYNVSVPNGNYEVTIMFAETYYDAAGKRIFNVDIEGTRVISGLDIFSRVGKYAALQEVRTVTVSDGALNIGFRASVDNADVCAIKVKLVSVPASYKLTRTATNGLIAANPSSGTNIYTANTNVSLTATPLPGFRFTGWSGDLSGSVKTGTISMTANKSVTAIFTPIPTYSISVNATNGVVFKSPSKATYLEGSIVSLKAIPDYGYVFSGWSGDFASGVNPVNITMNSNKNITANFIYVGATMAFATNSGGTAYTSADGNYSADANYVGGGTYNGTNAISGTTDDILYQSERSGSSFNYNIPLANGSYTVRLKFAEIYHTSAGSRVFNIAIQGNIVSSNLDIWSKVGKDAAYDEVYPVTVTAGTLNIAFTSVKDGAKVSAIMVYKLNTVAVTGVSVSPTTASINVAGNQLLTATVAPANATIKNVIWSSSNTAVATVSASGLVTGISAGTATITVTTQDGAKTATCAVTVVSTSVNIPAKIEAENYSTMSGVQSESCSEGTLNVGWIETGDWMEYRVNAPSASNFTIDYRVASPNTGSQILCVNASGQTLSTTNVPNTGNWQTYTTVSSTSIALPAGVSVIRVKAGVGGFNINWLEFKSANLIPNGTYSLKSKTGVFLTATTSIGVLKSRTTENANYTKWVFNHLGNDVYEIKSAQFANERMEVPNGTTTAGSLVATTNYTGAGEHLKWKATKANGYFMFEPMHCLGSMALDAWAENPDVVHIWNKDVNNNNQWFEVINASGVALKSASIETTNVDFNKSADNSITVYPNPASSLLYVKSNNSSKTSEIEIYNLNGQLIYSVNATNSITEIDTKTFKSKGIVMVKVSSENDVSIFKVVIQ